MSKNQYCILYVTPDNQPVCTMKTPPDETRPICTVLSPEEIIEMGQRIADMRGMKFEVYAGEASGYFDLQGVQFKAMSDGGYRAVSTLTQEEKFKIALYILIYEDLDNTFKCFDPGDEGAFIEDACSYELCDEAYKLLSFCGAFHDYKPVQIQY